MLNDLTYDPSSGLLAYAFGGVTRFYTLWDLARLGIVEYPIIAQAILT